ncbi:multidrug ABC transporter ATP-binding protein [Longispora fulva]|uniref:ATP-binding cassette subfamily C protein n=1 Tax=Longispora fulva TaxID=619741 RepID=A0A8J7KVU6_9ACTN|nr:ABC transporter ATP-binding protein [Longispora fulva]MBG6135737.1 ATP-binding cassette subfamily C protein [Longispora fulva]GIG56023.1 multidrug ABC transporter ATP-binding protein [Longispora fulva]
MTHLPIAGRREVRLATVGLIRGDRRAMAAVLALYCSATLAGLAGPWLVGRIIDQVQHGADVSTVDVLAGAAVVAVIAQILLTRAARYAGYRFGERALALLRERFMDRALDLPIATVERAGTGDLMTRASVDVAALGTSARDAAPEIFISVVQVVFILGAVVVIDPVLGLCSLVATPALWMVARWYLRRAREAYLAEGAATTRLSEELAATAEGARTIEVLRMRPARVGSGDRSIGTAFAARVRTLALRSVLFPVAEAAHAFPVAVALVVGAVLMSHGRLSLGSLVAAALYLTRLGGPVDWILQWMETLQSGAASLARLEGIGRIPTTVPQQRAEPDGDRIDVSGVTYAYHEGHDVLHDVSLSVRPGERLAIVGPSGAGKSTLGRLLAGIDTPGRGSVTVGGVPVGQLPPDELRRRIALVTQEHHVFLGTLRDNLALAAAEAGDERMGQALAAVGADWAADLPDGLDTMLGAGGMTLDASRAQQLALARLVLADPHTLILDEATSMLDPTAARDTERSLAAVLEGRTVIAIAHRLHTAHDADRVAVMEHGRVTELGAHDELVAASGTYASLWRSWHGG